MFLCAPITVMMMIVLSHFENTRPIMAVPLSNQGNLTEQQAQWRAFNVPIPVVGVATSREETQFVRGYPHDYLWLVAYSHISNADIPWSEGIFSPAPQISNLAHRWHGNNFKDPVWMELCQRFNYNQRRFGPLGCLRQLKFKKYHE